MKGDFIKLGQRSGRRMVADDHGNIAGRLAGALSVKQIGKTVVIAGNQDDDLGAVIGRSQVILDHETPGHRLEVFGEFSEGNIKAIQVPFQPRQEQGPATVHVVVGMQDTAVVSNQKLGDRGHHAFPRQRDGNAEQ